MAHHIIEVKDLVKKYKKAAKNAVDNISFHVEEGEFFAFLGPNGAGKTTTISILTTTLAKTSGTVNIAGFDIDKNQADVRQNVGIIFQNPSLDRNLSAEENIRLHAILYGLYPYRPSFALMPEKYKKQIKELAEIVGLKEEIYKPIGTFSGGMKRKLEIIRGLMHHPKVLFLDEPTVGLDPISRRSLWEYIQDVRKKQNTTIFLTTHYLDEVEGCDHIAIVDHGKIISFGTPENIKKDLVKGYVLIDAHPREALIKELKSLKIPYKEDKGIIVSLEDYNPQKLIQSIKTPLTVLKTHTPSFEDAYLEIVRKYEEE
jgi:ABC-2 type transport system ATP-binding protein